MPSLIITPDMSAETWLGAAGCARGSQTWSGMMPAFEPNPIRASSEDRVPRCRRRGRGGRAEVGEVERGRVRAQAAGTREQEGQADLGHAEIPAGGPHRLRLVALRQDEEVGRQRHALPHEQERHHVVGERHEAHGQEEHVQHRAEQPERVAALVRGRVADAVEGRRRGRPCSTRTRKRAPRASRRNAGRPRPRGRRDARARRPPRWRATAQAEQEPGAAARDRADRGRTPRAARPPASSAAAAPAP